MKPKISATKNNKCIHEDNSSSQQSPLIAKQRLQQCQGENNSESKEGKSKELNPEHKELKQQIFAVIRLMLEPIKDDIEQIKIDQQGLQKEAGTLTGKYSNSK